MSNAPPSLLYNALHFNDAKKHFTMRLSTCLPIANDLDRPYVWSRSIVASTVARLILPIPGYPVQHYLGYSFILSLYDKTNGGSPGI